MHIIQIIDSLGMGGAQKMQVFLAQSLKPLGIKLTVISLSNRAEPVIVNQLKALDVQVVSFPFPRLFSPISFVRLIKYLGKDDYALIHTYLTYSNIIGSFAGWLLGVPVIASLRSAKYVQHKYAFRRQLEDFSLQHLAKRVLANGTAVGDFCRKRSGRTPVDIIENAVDMIPPLKEGERNAFRKSLVKDSRRPLVLSVGRLTKAKGFFDLLDAFSIIHKQKNDVALVIAGGGELKDKLADYVGKLGLLGSVFLLGIRHDTHRLLAAADIYVNSSHWEGTPVSVLEAMSAGLPVVATTVGENKFLVTEGIGILIPPSDPEKLAAAILSLLDAPERRKDYGISARASVEEKYGRINWTRKLITLYSKITPAADEYLRKIESNSGIEP